MIHIFATICVVGLAISTVMAQTRHSGRRRAWQSRNHVSWNCTIRSGYASTKSDQQFRPDLR